MGVTASTPEGEDPPNGTNVSVEHVRALLDTLENAVILANRDGQVLALNERAKKSLLSLGFDGHKPLNILRDLFQVDGPDILRRLENGQDEIALSGVLAGKPYHARLRCIRESDWLAVELDARELSVGRVDGIAPHRRSRNCCRNAKSPIETFWPPI